MGSIGEDYAALKRRAEAATPGPWKLAGTTAKPCPVVVSDHPERGYQVHSMLHLRNTDVWPHMHAAYCRDAAFIAAASPDVVLSLLEQLAAERMAREAAERDRDTWRQACAQVEARAEQAEGQQRSDFAKMQAWRERAEQAERERDEARSLVETRTTEAMVAQAEREATLRMWREYKDTKDADVASADAARERAEADNAALLAAFGDEEVQWATRSDWQGLCPLRNTHGCEGTNGRISAMGTPRPKPHGEHCPFRLLTEPHPGAALLERLRALEKVRETAEPYRLASVGDAPWPRADVAGRLSEACAAADALKWEACEECGLAGTHKLQCGRRW